MNGLYRAARMAATHAHAPGARVARFVLIDTLGRGAQATVWRAHDARLDREVALKLLQPDAGAISVNQWLHEARAVSRLSHPRSCRCSRPTTPPASHIWCSSWYAAGRLKRPMQKKSGHLVGWPLSRAARAARGAAYFF
jgi:serine/threonine protein kinase